MDCPACGLVNPPDVPKCDCGYDFVASKPADAPGWPIRLTWRQWAAAFWAISWPAWLGSLVIVPMLYGNDFIQSHISVFASTVQLGFFGLQAVLTRRLVTKNYGTFRVYVVRDSGPWERTLSMREVLSVWLRILPPQLALMLIATLMAGWWGTERASGISSLLWLFQFFLAGPIGISLAMRATYSKFRLEAYGFRYI